MFTSAQLEWCRQQFPALQRQHHGRPVVYFDGPAGTQVPQRVIDAIGDYLSRCNANHDGAFATSIESDAILHETHQAAADLLGANDADEIIFGPNMTTLTFALSRAMARTWSEGDEIIVTRLDHDANVSPWVLAAEDAGATVRWVGINRSDCTLDMNDLRQALNARTRLVAIGCASNSVGSINPLSEIIPRAHDCGALVFLDAVHYVPHRMADVTSWSADFLACSVYKFFGPHIGILWGRRGLLESLPAYKVRPATDDLPGKWMNGTQNHECLAGTLAAIDYLADLGRYVKDQPALARRDALHHAYQAIQQHERHLAAHFLEGISSVPEITLYGIHETARMDERMPTFSIVDRRQTPQQLAGRLADAGIFVWHGNYYALELSEALQREPEGMVRIGLAHYNTREEVDRLLEALQ